MTSNALKNLTTRLKDIDQLLNAHTAITKFKKAEQAAQNAGGQLAQVAQVFNALVTDPGPGKPKEVDAINRAAFVLSMAHFQGFVDELHAELGSVMLNGKAVNPDAVIKLVKPQRSNPHVNVINQMFSGIGVYELMESLRWQKCDNKTVKSRLTGYLETRNKIAHGSKVPITKGKVSQLKQFIELLAAKLDDEASSKAKLTLNKKPW
jgi:hypothetical protein